MTNARLARIGTVASMGVIALGVGLVFIPATFVVVGVAGAVYFALVVQVDEP